MFDHYLITRFNLRYPQWDVTKNNSPLLTDDWMENRLWLFENFCFPSVIAQRNKNFTWVLYLDETTTPKFRIRLEQLTAMYCFIKIFYIEGMSLFLPSIKNYIAENSSTPFIITTRLDNDDCVHIDFINEIQKTFNQQEFQAIDLIKGYTLQIEPKYILGKKDHMYNPFISLIERNSEPNIVWSIAHTTWKKETRIQQITDRRLWMSIIHDKNKVNEFDGYGKVNWDQINEKFVVSTTSRNTISTEIIPFNEWQLQSFKNYLNGKIIGLSKVIKKSIGVYKVK